MHRVVIALTALLTAGGAAVVGVFMLLAGTGADQAARLAPADTVIYANVYLQPSSGQSRNIAALLGRLPGFGDASTLDAKIDEVAQNLLTQASIDYRGQVKPWLGAQVAVALRADDLTATGPAGMALISVKDVPAAQAALAEIAGETSSETYRGTDVHLTPDGAYAFVDGMLVVGPRASVEAAIDVSEGAPALSSSSSFAAAMATLPDDHVATLFVDTQGLMGMAEADASVGIGPMAAAVVVEEDALRMVGGASFDSAAADETTRAAVALSGEPSSLAQWMPADTQAEIVIFGLRQQLEAAEASAVETPDGQSVGDTLASLRTLAGFGLGIDLDADVLPLLDREVALAVAGLESGVPRGQLLLRPSDPEAARAALERITDALETSGATVDHASEGTTELTTVDAPQLGTVTWATIDDILILGLRDVDVLAAITAHDTGDNLATRPEYVGAWEVAGARAGNELWVDVAGLVDALRLAEGLDGDLRDILQELGTLAFTAPSHDDQIEFRAVLTVE